MMAIRAAPIPAPEVRDFGIEMLGASPDVGCPARSDDHDAAPEPISRFTVARR